MLKLLLASLALFQTILAIPVPSKGGVQFNKRDVAWNYETDKVRGVNLGGWFVLEAFISPSLFEPFGPDESQIPVDEYHLTQRLGKDLAKERLEAHWNSWIVEKDFEQIAALGLNLVRIPIGYWAFGLLENDPYVQGQEAYLDKAIEWARTYGLKVWVDLHGAPGSQNGFDNSGLRDNLGFQSDENIHLTLTVLQHIFNKYGAEEYNDVIVGIELLNEPLGPALDLGKLNDFWTWGYKNLRSTGSIQNVIIQDAFTPAHYFDDKFLIPDFWNVVIDHHHYQVFSAGELQRTIDEHVAVACSWGQQAETEWHWNICGEWSAALTDCTRWLNGVNRGARYEGNYDGSPYIGSCAGSQDYYSWSEEKKVNTRRYIEAQLDAFEKRGGWIFWTWKTEATLEWDFQRLTFHSLFPSPLTDRQYPGQCN